VFRKLPTPLKSGPSVRRANLKRAFSKESESHHNHYPEMGVGNQDSGVVMDPAMRGIKVREISFAVSSTKKLQSLSTRLTKKDLFT
jgi:hypothetical protein